MRRISENLWESLGKICNYLNSTMKGILHFNVHYLKLLIDLGILKSWGSAVLLSQRAWGSKPSRDNFLFFQ